MKSDRRPTRSDLPPSSDRSHWYEAAFQRDYLERYRDRDQAHADSEVATVTARLPLNRGPVLDLCCGGGRHLRSLRSAQIDAYGVDLSEPLLREAQRALPQSDAWRVVRADMRRLPFAASFTTVLSFFTSFGYFASDAENAQVLREVARVLRPGGCFLLDLMDRAWTLAHLVPESHHEEPDRTRVERRWVTEDGQRVEKEAVTTSRSGETRTAFESVRAYSPAEIHQQLRAVGLEVDEMWGSFAGEAHQSGSSRRMIVVAKKESA